MMLASRAHWAAHKAPTPPVWKSQNHIGDPAIDLSTLTLETIQSALEQAALNSNVWHFC